MRVFYIFGTRLSPKALLRRSTEEAEPAYAAYDPFVDDFLPSSAAGRFIVHGDIDLDRVTEDEVDAIKHRLRIATGATSHKDVASPVVVPSTESSPKPPPQSKMAVRTDPPTALPSADDDDPFESGLAAVRYENVMGRRPDPRKAAVRKPDAGD